MCLLHSSKAVCEATKVYFNMLKSNYNKLGDQLFDRPPFRPQNPPKPLDSTTSPFNHHYTKTNATSRIVL